MIDPDHPRLSVSRQCQLLVLPRSTRYHQSKPVPDKTLKLMKQIDELYMQHPFYGSRQMMRALRRLDYEVRWSRKTGQEGSLNPNPKNDQKYVQEKPTQVQC